MHLPVLGNPRPGRVVEARPDPAVRGERLFALVAAALQRVDRWLGLMVQPRFHPIAKSGAIANTMFLIAAISGALLLFWYSPSVSKAHASLEAMRGSPLTAQLMRSVHRYSSDGCMLFVLVHACKLTAERRFVGARWLAWVTGIFLIGILWFVGWLGYWLVWDGAAQQVALGTARMLDGLPVFADPLSRSFLTDASINSLLFFMVFFFHMLIPLAMAIPLWLHITRLNRPDFLADRTMTGIALGSLVALSLVLPAASESPAKMAIAPTALHIDAWYLLPLWVTDRLGGGALWALTLVGGLLLFSLPWWIRKGRALPAVVDPSKCNACRNCYTDCPYNAISMVPRSDGRQYSEEARVDATKCVGCGICAGSCDSAGVGIPQLTAVETRARMDRWIDELLAEGSKPRIAFVCASSAAADFTIDASTGRCAELPDYRVVPVVCIGWVHMLTVERALRHGAEGVLLIGCSTTDCPNREGVAWTAERLAGLREPGLRRDKLDPSRVLQLSYARRDRAAVIAAAARFAEGAAAAAASSRAARPSLARQLVAGAALALLFTGSLGAASRLPYPGPPTHGSELVVSFKHPGRSGEHCRTLSAAELDKLPPHMRRPQICERGRAPVRLRILVDGEQRLDERYRARGVSGDGNSVAIAALPIGAGDHRVRIQIGDSNDPNEWTFQDERTVTLSSSERLVVLFDKLTGFTWYGRQP